MAVRIGILATCIRFFGFITQYGLATEERGSIRLFSTLSDVRKIGWVELSPGSEASNDTENEQDAQANTEAVNHGYLETYVDTIFTAYWHRVCMDEWSDDKTYVVCREMGYTDGRTLRDQFVPGYRDDVGNVMLLDDCNMTSETMKICFREALSGRCRSKTPIYLICYPMVPKQTNSNTVASDETLLTVKANHVSNSVTSSTDSTVGISFLKIDYSYAPLVKLNSGPTRTGVTLNNRYTDTNNETEEEGKEDEEEDIDFEVPICRHIWPDDSSKTFCRSLGYAGGFALDHKKNYTQILKKSANVTNTKSLFCNRLSAKYSREQQRCNSTIQDVNCQLLVIDCYIRYSLTIIQNAKKMTINVAENKSFVIDVYILLNELRYIDIELQFFETEKDLEESYNTSTAISTRTSVSLSRECAESNKAGRQRVYNKKYITFHFNACQQLKISMEFNMPSRNRINDNSNSNSDKPQFKAKGVVLTMESIMDIKNKDHGFFGNPKGITMLSVLVIFVIAFICFTVRCTKDKAVMMILQAGRSMSRATFKSAGKDSGKEES